MSGAWRVFRQELLQLLDGYRGILLVFVLPPLFLGLVGQLSVTAPPFQVRVAGTPAETGQPSVVYDELLALLREVSSVQVSNTAERALDPLAAIQDGDLDLLLNLEGPDPEDWLMYTATESRLRLNSVRQFAAGLERALGVIEIWAEGRDPDAEEDIQAEFGRWATELQAMGGVSSGQMVAYYPRALDRTTDLVASTLVLILCFLPFVLAAPSLIREKEAHTLEVVLAAPGINARTLLAGKCLFVVVVALAELLLLVVLAQSLYGIHVKPGFLMVPLLFLPAILATALLGLAVSALAQTQAQVGMASALFFLAITLLTGFFVPLEEASGLIRALSRLFPLTLVMPSFRSWTLGAQPLHDYWTALAGLWIQCLVYGAIARAALRHALRQV